jgi:hypothetical protein
MKPNAEDLRAILTAYQQVVEASWPQLHPTMRERSRRWLSASDKELQSELDAYVAESSSPSSQIRLFWKFAPNFEFGGCNRQFAEDAGFTNPADLVGITDFDQRLPWTSQAAKYRHDDQAVVEGKRSHLDIIERQKSPTGAISWVRVGKVPIQRTDGTAIGVLGMYEVLDAATARKLYGEQALKGGAKPEKG